MIFECSTLIFDLDGTISDPSLGITRCINHALTIHGFPKVSDNIIEQEIGPPLDETFAKLAQGANESVVISLISTYRERYAEVGYSENTMYPDIPLILEQLKQSGMSLGVCTSKRKDFADKILSMFEIAEYFEFVSGGDVGITKSSQLAGLKKSEAIDGSAIMVGDRYIDIQSATDNRLRSIGVLWGFFGDYEELSKYSPTFIAERVQDIPDYVTVIGE